MPGAGSDSTKPCLLPLWGYFKIVTDNSALSWLETNEHQTPNLALWAILLQTHAFSIVHRSGSQHKDAEFPSHNPSSRDLVGSLYDVCYFTSTMHLTASEKEGSEIKAIVRHFASCSQRDASNQQRRGDILQAGVLFHRQSAFSKGRHSKWLRVVLAVCIPVLYTFAMNTRREGTWRKRRHIIKHGNITGHRDCGVT